MLTSLATLAVAYAAGKGAEAAVEKVKGLRQARRPVPVH